MHSVRLSGSSERPAYPGFIAGWFEGDSGSFEDKGTEVSNDNSLNGQDLLGYHGQYLASGG